MEVFIQLPAYEYQHIVEDIEKVLENANENLGDSYIKYFELYHKTNNDDVLENWICFCLSEFQFMYFSCNHLEFLEKYTINFSKFLEMDSNNSQYKSWNSTKCLLTNIDNINE